GKDNGAGGLAQDASSAPRAIIDPQRQGRIEPVFVLQGNVMTLLLLEALGALLLLVFIVWWTMFSGRRKGELKDEPADPAADAPADRK
ncbi:hypothetical protein, partial [Polaromonas sp.]|uniref:hypothetical protein n=1 Tax=Polaromonas sp. TaxID=1869339 RepID=UPI00286B7588